MIRLEDLKNNEDVRVLIERADASLKALGYTEHSFAHVTKSAETAGYILRTLGYGEREVELARVAGYLHDIGNLVNRSEHSQSGAVMAFVLLTKMGLDMADVADVTTAIGNHDEGTGVPVNPIAAALILADKADVRRSRVRLSDGEEPDIHDRVNYSVERADLSISSDRKSVTLAITLNSAYSSVMDYFVIFTERMLMCRRAAESLGLRFGLIINDQILM